MVPEYNSALYVTRANAYNAANIWNVVMPVTDKRSFVDVRDKSMLAIDYINCYNCANHFIYSINPLTIPTACRQEVRPCTRQQVTRHSALALKLVISFSLA